MTCLKKKPEYVALDLRDKKITILQKFDEKIRKKNTSLIFSLANYT